MMRWLVILVILTHCKIRDPLFCDEDTPCTDPALPYCDAWGVFEESQFIANTCIAEPEQPYCPTSFASCENGVGISCIAGQFEVSQDCALGCHPSEPRCVEVLPTNELAEYLARATNATDVNLLAPARYSAGRFTYEGGEISVETEMVGNIEVVMLGSLSVGELRISGARVAFVVADEVVFNGELVVGRSDLNDFNVPARDSCTADGKGGPGESFGGVGGKGSNLARAPFGREDLLLLPHARGPNSAGAVQIVSSNSITVQSGFINAAGNGGDKGGLLCTVSPLLFSYGGGAGGAVLLEAPSVTFTDGTGITANGGSGACSNKRGNAGTLSLDQTPIMDCGNNGAGGAGGAANNVDGGDGTTGSNQDCANDPNNGFLNTQCTGGGGGSAGRIRINVADNQLTIADGVIMSPAPSVGELMTR